MTQTVSLTMIMCSWNGLVTQRVVQDALLWRIGHGTVKENPIKNNRKTHSKGVQCTFTHDKDMIFHTVFVYSDGALTTAYDNLLLTCVFFRIRFSVLCIYCKLD